MYLLCFFMNIFVAFSLTANTTLQDVDSEEISIRVARSVEDIDYDQGKRVLVESFMHGYEDVPLVELNPSFQSIGDMRRFYQDYFDSELGHYEKGELIWVQAFRGDRLLGWATFELEPEEENAAYMNLLVVDPKEQRKGIGKSLVFSICAEYPNITEMRILIRNINVAGRIFYEKIGFSDFSYDREDNFVDISLLT